MNKYLAQIKVKIKPEINDPEGSVIRQSLERLGFDGVESLRTGSFFELKIQAANQQKAEKRVNEMCRELLAHPVMENFEINVEEI